MLILMDATLTMAQRREEGNLVLEGVPEVIPQNIIDRFKQYQNTRFAAFRDWTPDGKGILIGSRFADVSQVHRVDMPGGARHQLTFFDEPVRGAAVPDDENLKGFLFRKDLGGSEQFQLFYYDMLNGESTMLSDGENQFGSGIWANKGSRYVYRSNKRNGKDYDVYLADLNAPGKDKMIFEGEGAWYPFGWCNDDSHILMGNYVSATNSKFYVLNIESGDYYQVNPSDEEIAYGGAIFNKTDDGLFFISDENEQFTKLRYYDLESKKQTLLTGNLDWNVEEIELSKDGSKLAFTANEGGINTLYIMDTETLSYSKLEGVPKGQVYGLSFHPDGNKLAMTVNSSQYPSDVFVYDFNSKESVRWTYSEVGGLNTSVFSDPEIIEFETFDEVDGKKRKIPAFYYKPPGDGPFPVLVNIHGGPESQHAPYFNPFFQYILQELNIAILAPNVRGSSGYGKEYIKLDNGFKREDSVKDIGGLLDWIENNPELDASKIAVGGGSYGGYMVYASMIMFGDRIKCGVSSVGISNFVTFLKNTKSYRRDLRRVEYGDERDPEMNAFLEKISPTNNAKKLTQPIYIVQGANDPRVPLSEAEQMLEKVKSNGQDVWYLMAKDEGHGFRKKANRDYYLTTYLMFLEKHLLEK